MRLSRENLKNIGGPAPPLKMERPSPKERKQNILQKLEEGKYVQKQD